jgi:nucleoid DNA-binding protein
LYERVGGFSQREAASLVDNVFDSIKEKLGQGERA